MLLRDTELSPALPTIFATLDAAKAFLGVSGSGNDATITALLQAASYSLEAYCGCILESRTITETIDLDETSANLMLRYCPAAAITSISFEDEAMTVGDYRLNKLSAIVRSNEGVAFGKGKWVVVYTAGHFAAASAPADVQQATLRFVRDLWNTKDVKAHIAAQSVPDVASVQYVAGGLDMEVGPTGTAIPFSAAAMIGRYVQRFLP